MVTVVCYYSIVSIQVLMEVGTFDHIRLRLIKRPCFCASPSIGDERVCSFFEWYKGLLSGAC